MKKIIAFFLLTGLALAQPFPFSFWKKAGGGTVVGNTTIGANPATLGAGIFLFGAKFTAPLSGNVTSISIYSSNSNAALKIKVGLYSDASGPNTGVTGSPVEFTPGTFSAGWKQYTGLSIPVVSGLSYWITMIVDTGSAMTTYNDTGASGIDYYGIQPYSSTWTNYPLYTDTSNLSFKAIIQ